RLSLIGFGFMLIAGIGTMMVGIFPENTTSILHLIGATLPFLLGNVGILLLGIALYLPKGLKLFSFSVGIISLIALIFFVLQVYLGIGIGGMERITAYPQTLWLIVFGLYISNNHFSRMKIVKNR